MATADKVIEAYPIALRTKDDLVFEVIEAGTVYFIGVEGLRIFQFDKKSDADKFASDLNKSVKSTVDQIKDFYNTEVEKIIGEI